MSQTYAAPTNGVGQKSLNGIKMLRRDHRKVDRLFNTYAGLGKRKYAQKLVTINRIIRELSIHANVEHEIFYPTVSRLQTTNGKFLSRMAHEQTDAVMNTLLEMQKMVEDVLPTDSDVSTFIDWMRLDELVHDLIKQVGKHVSEEERDMLTPLDEVLQKEEKQQLGHLIEEARKLAPLRPSVYSSDRGFEEGNDPDWAKPLVEPIAVFLNNFTRRHYGSSMDDEEEDQSEEDEMDLESSTEEEEASEEEGGSGETEKLQSDKQSGKAYLKFVKRKLHDIVQKRHTKDSEVTRAVEEPRHRNVSELKGKRRKLARDRYAVVGDNDSDEDNNDYSTDDSGYSFEQDDRHYRDYMNSLRSSESGFEYRTARPYAYDSNFSDPYELERESFRSAARGLPSSSSSRSRQRERSKKEFESYEHKRVSDKAAKGGRIRTRL